MKRRPLIAIAPCTFRSPQLPPEGQGNLAQVQVTPAGFFRPADGRDLDVPGWYIDASRAALVIERFRQRKTPLVLDYEHQTLHKETNGQPAPAAGWFRDLHWIDDSGLWATVELTGRARQYLESDEYLYFSPVFGYDPVTGDVLELHMGALTNSPGVDGMEAIGLLAAATFGLQQPEEQSVNQLLKAMIVALGLAENTTEEQAVAALNARLTQDPLADLRKALALDEKADTRAIVTACTALRAQAAQADNPDPARYVSVDVVKGIQEQVAALSTQLQHRAEQDVDDMVDAALEDGRLLKPLEQWARDLGRKDVAALTAYLGAAQPLPALAGSQTHGNPPQADDKTGLTKEELAVCTAMNLAPEHFKAAKEEN